MLVGSVVADFRVNDLRGTGAYHADGFGAPEAFDEPALLGRDEHELVSLAYG
jgi:hypothetical protein